MRQALIALLISLAPGLASAAVITIPLPAETEVETIEAAYDCGGDAVTVSYINAGGISLAVLAIGGETVVAANVVSGSGARYAGAQYIWWTKGDDAMLYDLTQGGEDEPAAHCTAVN